ncbi:MAG: CotH kinase family protein, partial [Verrucomicrobiales bacterium]
MDEEHIIYGCEARSAGSPWHEGERPNIGLKGKYKTPRSKSFRGRIKSTWDQDPTSGRQHNDKMTQYWMYLLGHPVSDTEFIQVVINSGSSQLRAEVEAPSDNGFMDRHWENGSQGQMFRIDDEWTFPDNFGSKPSKNAEWTYKEPNGDRGGRYHAEWMLRSREVEYDYEPIVSLFKMTTEGEFTQAQAERIIHTEQMAINIAVRGYIGDWDTFSINRGKNGFMYRRSTDGKFQFIHWDSDLAFQGTSEAFLNGAGNPAAFRNWHREPYFRRLYNYYLTELLEEYTQGSSRMNAFFEAEENSSDDYTMNDGKYTTWFSGRRTRTQSEIGSDNMGAPFKVTTEGGDDFSVAEDFLTLEGEAGSDVYDVILKDYPEHYPKPKLEWLSEIQWRLSGIVLAEGENALAIRATN